MAIVTYPLNGILYNAENAETYLCTRTSGVYSSDDNFSIQADGTMQVTVNPGLAWIKNGDFSGKSVVNTEPVILSFALADGVLNRKDRIVLRFDVGLNATEIIVKQGTPSSEAQPKPIERTGTVYELGLYVVNIPAGTVGINSSNITSTMLDESVCGIMRDGVTGIPTAQLQEQAESLMRMVESSLIEFQIKEEQEFTNWFDSVKDILDESVAGNLQNQITENKEISDSHIANKSNPHSVSASQIGAVPTSRTINGQALTGNINLTASNVGAMPLAGGTFTGPAIAATPASVATAQLMNIYAGTEDMSAGVSELATGTLYLVYE